MASLIRVRPASIANVMKNNGRFLAFSAIVSLTAATSAGRAAGFNDDFEGYAVGSNLHGQNGWKGWDNVATAGAVVSSAFSLSPTKSVNVSGGSDLVHEFPDATSGVWSFSLDQYIPASSTGDTYVILMNKYKDTGAAADYNWSVQTHMNMGTGVVTADNGSGATSTLVKDQWVNLTFTIDLTANKVDEYYNYKLLSTHVWQTGGANTLAAVDLYANNAGPVYYDNLKVSQVPEPTTIALLGLGGLALVLRRKGQ